MLPVHSSSGLASSRSASFADLLKPHKSANLQSASFRKASKPAYPAALPPTPSKSKRSQPTPPRCIALCALLLSAALVALIWRLGWRPAAAQSSSHQLQTAQGSLDHARMAAGSFLANAAMPAAHTLVVYVFAGNDPEYVNNLQFFITEGITEGDGCQYIIVLQQGSDLQQLEQRPVLPGNAHYLEHSNACYDIGTVGWLLDSDHVDISKYRYLVWLNSSVRGPFLPAYLRGRLPSWTAAFTDKLNDQVKLVGATINCGRAYELAPQPHVQTYVVATDMAGLRVLRDKGTVFSCHQDMAALVMQSELGASKAILDAGYNLDCLQLRYQGLDWRDSRAASCNANSNPIQNEFYDGISIDPLEVLFVKVKASMSQAMWYHVRQAEKYSRWATEARGLRNSEARFEAIAHNQWTDIAPFRQAEATQHGQACFDAEFYVNANRFDLSFIEQQPDPQAAAFQHFIMSGTAGPGFGSPYDVNQRDALDISPPRHVGSVQSAKLGSRQSTSTHLVCPDPRKIFSPLSSI